MSTIDRIKELEGCQRELPSARNLRFAIAVAEWNSNITHELLRGAVESLRKAGAEEIKAMMENFRTNRPKELGGSKVILTKDFQLLKAYDGDGNETAISMLQSSNVLQWYTEDGTKVSVRPSGTEPKIKFYVEVRGEIGCANCYKGACADAGEKVEMIMRELEKN